MDLLTIVQTLGLPVGTAVFFIWRDYQSTKEHKQDLKDFAIKVVTALDGSTEAIKDSTEQIKLSNAAISENSNILSRAKEVLSRQRGTNDGMVSGN
jgi:hypothetical protein